MNDIKILIRIMGVCPAIIAFIINVVILSCLAKIVYNASVTLPIEKVMVIISLITLMVLFLLGLEACVANFFVVYYKCSKKFRKKYKK